MTGKNHKAAAILGTLILADKVPLTTNINPVLNTIVIVAGGILGGYLPDLDTPNSHLGRKLLFLFWPLYMLQVLINLFGKIPGPYQRTIKKSGKGLGHRGVGHTPIFWILITTAITLGTKVLINYLSSYRFIMHFEYQISYVIKLYGFGCLVGIVTHLLMDMFSGGIMFFYPIFQVRIKLGSIKTGGIIDLTLTLIFTIVNIYLIINLIRH